MLTVDYTRCPLCLTRLEAAANGVTCTGCGRTFPVVDGVTDFSRNAEFYYCPTPRTCLCRLLDGYRTVLVERPERLPDMLQEVVDGIPDNSHKPLWIENLVDESRAAAKYLTAMAPDHHALNLGCGWDNTTLNLARTARRVSAIDLTRPRVRLLKWKLRCRGLDNVDTFCGGDTPHLPFADDTFDSVFINGVLEWAASDWSAVERASEGLSRPARALTYLHTVCTSHQPGRLQLRFLREVARVLKPSGEIFIGIENRFSREYFGGRPDHHSGILFGSLLPRLVAHVVSIATRHRPYLTYTYGIYGYRSLLVRSGLPLRRLFALEPDYRQPSRLVDLADPQAIRRFVRSRPGRMLRSLPPWLYRRTAPAFGLIGSTADERLSWFDRLAADLGAALGAGRRARLRGVTINRKGKLSLVAVSTDGSDRRWLVKVPMTPLAEANCRRHFRALIELRARAAGDPAFAGLRQRLPRSAGSGETRGQRWFAETLCPGRPWAAAEPAGDAALWVELRGLLQALARVPAAPLTADEERAAYGEKLELLGRLPGVEEPHLRALGRLRALIGEAVERRAGRSHWRKGDFSLSNVMVAGGRISGLIDFDEWRTASDPLIDTADVLLSWHRHRKSRYWVESLEHLAGSTVDEGGPALSGLLESRQADAGDLWRSSLVAWLDHAANACEHLHLRLNRRWVGRVVLAVLEMIDRRGAGP